MEERLKALERQLASFLRRSQQHDCILEETGVCPHCESYWDIREETEYEIMMEKEELAPLWAMHIGAFVHFLFCRSFFTELEINTLRHTSLQQKYRSQVPGSTGRP